MCRSEVKVGALISVTDKKSPAPIVFDDSDEEGDDSFVEVKKKKNKIVLSKPETIIKIIEDHPGEKFIVFSAHDESFDLIKDSFKDNNTEYVEIKGTREAREKKLAMYQTGDVDTIFLNAKFNGAGINLQMTGHIIYYHQMDPLMEIQLTGRANRIGREGPLTIHYLE
ncbi:MAG: C-terminal helicase domain-containing protein [Candidatus Colwellbacteria bacterium]|nr:C-terminal helicase domain-containing protein [Candidatus Colwellbacteria bacterium]